MLHRPPSAAKSKSKSKSGSKRPSSLTTKSKPTTKSQPRRQVKTKRNTHKQTQSKNRIQKVYTDKELDLPALNMITPVGIPKPRGKKKGKVFADDAESMMTIFAMVNAEKQGQIESKIMNARQVEEIREARRREAEARRARKTEELEETKKSFKKIKRQRADEGPVNGQPNAVAEDGAEKKSKKKVSFA